MEIVKKNILSVVCGAVALVALIALVWPVSGMYTDEQTVINKSKQIDADATGLTRAQRFWPVIPDLQSGDKTQLKQFPTEDVIKAGVAIKDQVKDQATRMAHDIVRDNKHDLLVEDILPNPKDLRFRFQQEYLRMVQDSPASLSQLRLMVEGTVPPTDLDVHAEADRMWNADYKTKILTVGGQQVNFPQVQTEWQEACAGLEAKLRSQAARRAKLYVEPNWLSIQKQMLVVGASPKDNDIWYAQNMLWVQMDLVDAIKRINASAHNVEDATIKHIFAMEIPDDGSMYSTGSNNGSAAAPPAPTDLPPKVYSVSQTGRVCNPMYDVINFQLVINVEASKIPIVLTELQRNKLITILQADHSAVNGVAAADSGFVYGDVPVARLTIRGEELFLRDWTTPLMPASIQQLLQITPPAAGAAPAQAPAMSPAFPVQR